MSTTTIIPNTTKWLSDDALADRWEVTVRTIQRWERDDPDFPRARLFGKKRKRRSLEDVEAYERSRPGA